MIDYNEFKNRLLRLKETLERVQKIDGSLADDPEKHRNFAKEIEIDYTDLKTIYESSELNLMIEYYTFSEQLVKELVFSILTVESSNDNKHLEKFLKNSFRRNKYSPRSQFEDIKKDVLDKYIQTNDKKLIFLLFNTDGDFTKIHDSLIKARHKYAHNSIRPDFSISEYVERSLPSLDFLLNEFINIESNLESRLSLQQLILDSDTMKSQLDKLNIRSPYYKNKLKDFKNNLKSIMNYQSQLECTSSVYNEIFEQSKKYQTLDLRLSKNTLKSRLEEIKFVLRKMSK